MPEEIATQDTSLVGPQSSVNLMEKSEEAPKSFAVDVHDEDKSNLPSDIIAEEEVSFWKRPDVRMWLYILAGAIIIFAIVFAVLSRETSLFKGYAITSPSDVDNQQTDDENIFGQFNNRASSETGTDETIVNNSTNSNSNSGTTQTTDNTGTDAQQTDTDESILANNIAGGPVTDITNNTGSDAQESNSEENIIANNNQNNNQNRNNDFEIIFDDSLYTNNLPGQSYSVPNVTFNDSLGSNTNANIMASSVVQGDTGPAIWIAMVPSMLYALGRRKK